MSKFRKHKYKVFQSSVALLLTFVILFLTSVTTLAVDTVEVLTEKAATAKGTAYMFSSQVVDEVVYNTASLTMEKLPEYMNTALGFDEIEEGKRPVSISEVDADELTSITTMNEDGTNTLYLFNQPV